MKGTMKVAVMNGIGQMGYTNRDIPQPKDNEVLVKLEYVGICGSDMHYYETGRIGDYVVEPPFVLGHEPGGTVVEVGKNVKHLKVGDRVALEPGKTCGHCEYCREGKYNLCPDVVFFATPPVDGVFQEYVAHEADLCFKLPENVSTLEGALIEPLAVGFHAANQGNAHAGQTALVFGAGCIGLVSMMALKAEGVSKVYVVDIMQKRLDKALENIVRMCVNCGTSASGSTALLMASIPVIKMAKPTKILPMSCTFCFLTNIIQTTPIIAKTGEKDDGFNKLTNKLSPSIPVRLKIHEVAVVPIFAPIIMPTACDSRIMPELTKPTTITVVAEDD